MYRELCCYFKSGGVVNVGSHFASSLAPSGWPQVQCMHVRNHGMDLGSLGAFSLLAARPSINKKIYLTINILQQITDWPAA